MAQEIYDVAVIGSGPGGYVAALRAAEFGLKTLCIEKESTFGGTCLNVGCIPSKALLQSTEHYSFLKEDAVHHGLIVKEFSCDFGKMQERKNEIVHGLTQGIDGLFKKNRIDIRHGVGKLVTSNRILIEGDGRKEEIETRNIILATGSKPIELPFLPFDEKRVLSSTGALALEKVPASMLLVGAGVIGVELASVYRRLGTEVTVIEMLDRVCPTLDPSMSKMLMQLLKKQGLNFYLGAKVLQGSPKDNSVNLDVDIGGEKKSFSSEVVLIAIGRKPYKEGLGLEELGIGLDSKGYVAVDTNFRTSQPNIYAIGDLIEGPMLAHKASTEGVAVAEIIAGRKPSVNYMTIPNVVYTHPEVAAVGLTEQEAADKGLNIIMGTALFKSNPRARAIGYTEGMVKVIAESQSRRLLGVHIIGLFASELIAEAALGIAKKTTLEEFVSLCYAHPTLSETIHEAMMNAAYST